MTNAALQYDIWSTQYLYPSPTSTRYLYQAYGIFYACNNSFYSEYTGVLFTVYYAQWKLLLSWWISIHQSSRFYRCIRRVDISQWAGGRLRCSGHITGIAFVVMARESRHRFFVFRSRSGKDTNSLIGIREIVIRERKRGGRLCFIVRTLMVKDWCLSTTPCAGQHKSGAAWKEERIETNTCNGISITIVTN